MKVQRGFVNRIVVFAVVAMSLFLILIAPWPGIGTVYLDAYRAVAERVFHQIRSPATLQFLLYDGEEPHLDTIIVWTKPEVPEPKPLAWLDAWSTAYLPTVKVIALILATPVSWRRRAVALFFGICTVQLFVGLRLYIFLVHYHRGPSPIPPTRFQQMISTVFEALYGVLCAPDLPVLLVPVLVWILVTIRREDLRLLIDMNFPSARAPHDRRGTVA